MARRRASRRSRSSPTVSRSRRDLGRETSSRPGPGCRPAWPTMLVLPCADRAVHARRPGSDRRRSRPRWRLARPHPAVAVPARRAVLEVHAVHHAVADEPVGGALARVRPVAEEAAARARGGMAPSTRRSKVRSAPRARARSCRAGGRGFPRVRSPWLYLAVPEAEPGGYHPIRRPIRAPSGDLRRSGSALRSRVPGRSASSAPDRRSSGRRSRPWSPTCGSRRASWPGARSP